MSDRSPTRYQGEVVEWSNEKRCGFIRPRGAKSTDPLVFVGVASMATKKRKPGVGDVLIYELITVPITRKNQRLRTPFRAERATFLGEEIPQMPDKKSESFIIFLGLFYLIILGCVSPFHLLALVLLAIDLLVSFGAFVAYWYDKSCAEGNRRRVPESTLQAWAFFGGWPGAALAQKVFRHKTRKASFQNIFRVMVVVNIALTVFVMFALWSS